MDDLLHQKLDTIIGLLQQLVKEKKPKEKKPKETSQIWNVYERYYELRWKVKPTRNAMINGMLANVAKRIPADDLEPLIKFYLSQNDAWYLREMHHPKCLVANCENLLTRMKNGIVITQSKAQEMSRLSDNLSTAQNYLKNKHGGSVK